MTLFWVSSDESNIPRLCRRMLYCMDYTIGGNQPQLPTPDTSRFKTDNRVDVFGKNGVPRAVIP